MNKVNGGLEPEADQEDEVVEKNVVNDLEAYRAKKNYSRNIFVYFNVFLNTNKYKIIVLNPSPNFKIS